MKPSEKLADVTVYVKFVKVTPEEWSRWADEETARRARDFFQEREVKRIAHLERISVKQMSEADE